MELSQVAETIPSRHFDLILNDHRINYVFIVARYLLYLVPERFDNIEGGVEPSDVLIVDSRENIADSRKLSDRQQTVKDAYKLAIDKLIERGKTIYLFYPIPSVGWDAPTYIAKKLQTERMFEYLTTSYTAYEQYNRQAFLNA